MKKLGLVGIAVLVAGIVMLVLGSLPRKEKHGASMMGVEMSVTTEERGPIPLGVSIAVMAAGAGLLAASVLAKKR